MKKKIHLSRFYSLWTFSCNVVMEKWWSAQQQCIHFRRTRFPSFHAVMSLSDPNNYQVVTWDERAHLIMAWHVGSPQTLPSQTWNGFLVSRHAERRFVSLLEEENELGSLSIRNFWFIPKQILTRERSYKLWLHLFLLILFCLIVTFGI